MGLFSLIFSFRGKIFRLRKKYDRLRERADMEDDAEKRLNVLKILDQVEPTLILLEEQNISRFDRQRLYVAVDSAIEQAKAMLEGRLVRKEIPIQR